MDDKAQTIAMALADRVYGYGLMRAVFGGRPDKATAKAVFGSQAKESLSRAVSDGKAADVRVGCLKLSTKGLMKKALDAVAEQSCKVDDALLEKLGTDYDQLFMVPGERYTHPWESPYLDSEEMLFRESTLDVRRFYHEAGFKLEGEGHFPDDHVAAMMGFLSKRGKQAYEAFADGEDATAADLLASQREFVKKHVTTWVDVFARDVAEHDDGLYAALAMAMAAFSFADSARLGNLEAQIRG